jgi:hypothetical protein
MNAFAKFFVMILEPCAGLAAAQAFADAQRLSHEARQPLA